MSFGEHLYAFFLEVNESRACVWRQLQQALSIFQSQSALHKQWVVPHPCQHLDLSAHTKEGCGVILPFPQNSLRALAFSWWNKHWSTDKQGKVLALRGSQCGGWGESGNNYYFQNREVHAMFEMVWSWGSILLWVIILEASWKRSLQFLNYFEYFNVLILYQFDNIFIIIGFTLEMSGN